MSRKEEQENEQEFYRELEERIKKLRKQIEEHLNGNQGFMDSDDSDPPFIGKDI